MIENDRLQHERVMFERMRGGFDRDRKSIIQFISA